MSGYISKNAVSVAEMAWVMQKVDEIKQHPAWRAEVDEIESVKLLTDESAFTYLLRPGKDKYNYVISYVEADGTVQHKPVKILLSARGWLYQNGTGNIRERISDLIPVAFHCTAEQCKPCTKGSLKFPSLGASLA